MKHAFLTGALGALLLAGCAATPSYGPAARDGAMGYTSQQIESGRFRISYTDDDPSRARDLALLRAAEVTLEAGKDWFQITNRYGEAEPVRSSSGTSVSVGGSTGSYGRSSVGVGVGIGFPIGGSSSGKFTEVLEIVTGAGDKPDDPNAYDARSVDINLRDRVTG